MNTTMDMAKASVFPIGKPDYLGVLTHTVMEWMDDKYRLLRQKLPSRQRMFNDIRALTSYLCFESWDALMAFMLQSFEPIPPARPKTG
ncbi:MAG: hypothetical protein IPI79_00010 [Moraxellaceae bacterium]|nr:hypothetical protein [Moraxellaceae bacterium]